MDLKTLNTYETRDINYPRTWASAINYNNQYFYAFGGQNPNYIEKYVDKIEKYLVGANDWITIKYNSAENIKYFPCIKSGVFRHGVNNIIILGGERN